MNFSNFTASQLQQQLATRLPSTGWTPTGAVEVVSETASTNSDLLNYARRLGALTPQRALLATLNQTQGRGRQGRRWDSLPGQTLALSLGWRLPYAASALEGMTLLCGLTLRQALAQQQVFAALKWPNDLLSVASEQKLAGILVELATLPTKELWLVIGVGLNLRSAPPDAVCVADCVATALNAEQFQLAQLVVDFVVDLEQRADVFFAHGFASFIDEFQQHHAWQQREVQILQNEQVQGRGHFIGINAQGAALIQTAQGLQKIASGELRLRTCS